MKKPNFFIIGAPKCGTSSLARWLSEHNSIFFCNPKEPAFFNKDTLIGTESLLEYEKLFYDADDSHIAIGEGTTQYLYSKVAIKEILNYQKDAKFIICLRNPVEMAISMHSERVYQGEEPIASFYDAWKEEKNRTLGLGIPSTMKKNSLFLQYGQVCKHGFWLENLFSQISKEKVHIVLLDEIKKNPMNVFDDVLSFLNVPFENSIQLKKYNPAKQVRSVRTSTFIKKGIHLKRKLFGNYKTNIAGYLRRMNSYQKDREEISLECKKNLLEYFISDINKLECILDRDLQDWKLI